MDMSDALSADWAKLPTPRELLDHIERVTLSADAKLLLARLTATTVEVGGRILEVGRRILAFVFQMVKTFPNIGIGLIIALVVSMLIASVPLLGGVLGPMLKPLLLAFGLTKGALADLKEGALRRRIESLEAEFRAVTA